ncbi:ArsC family reductase [Thiomicrorhabdus xiamenensis]|uniref:ArsC family reductase n=1 Tax=Thiomicrorhabdus xiamenensis TaxID=2739063 RepID=A0A7D4T129_9GAMM|nr:ArsC family reductase [Thiomicrorhabdus xiamenensis]QKI89245.1 ArsC family reductase [Thiomicrorhabdus xiamenensis]
MTTMYGIANCDTIKKARKFLDTQNIPYQFHDFRKDGLKAEQIEVWLQKVTLAELINKRSTSWRNLDEQLKTALQENSPQAVEIILQQPTLIKRPVLEKGDSLLIGFKEAEYKQLI